MVYKTSHDMPGWNAIYEGGNRASLDPSINSGNSSSKENSSSTSQVREGVDESKVIFEEMRGILTAPAIATAFRLTFTVTQPTSCIMAQAMSDKPHGEQEQMQPRAPWQSALRRMNTSS